VGELRRDLVGLSGGVVGRIGDTEAGGTLWGDLERGGEL
jgi:hypothetical protein